MRNPIWSLFTRSPFGPLQEHMQKAKECVDRVRPMLGAAMEGNAEGAREIAKEIFRLEHEADEIKNQIRDHLPRSILLPVNRADFIQLLKTQDGIPDGVEDLAGLLTMRPLDLPEDLRPLLEELVEAVLATFEAAFQILDRFDDLLSASFRGAEGEQVLELINRVGHLEWKADKAQYRLTKEMFQHESELGPVSVFVLMQILRVLGGIANECENTADRIRMMIAH